MEQKKIPYAYLADWYGKSFYQNFVWSKYDIERGKELGLVVPGNTTNKPQRGYTQTPKAFQPEITLTPERHLTVSDKGKHYWFYPAVLQDIYDQTGKLYYKDELKMPPIASILELPKYEPFTDLEMLRSVIHSPRPGDQVHAFIRFVAYYKDQPTHDLLALVPDAPTLDEPVSLEYVSSPIKKLTLEMYKRLNTDNSVLAACELVKNLKCLVDTRTIAKYKEEVDEGTTLMI